MDAQTLDAFGELVALRDDHSTVAVAAKVLRWEEAQSADRRGLAGHHPLAIDLAPSTDRLRGILDHRDVASRLHNCLDRRHLSEQIHRNDCLGRRRDRRPNRVGRDVEGVGIDISEDDFCADVVRRAAGGEESERRRNDFVATADVERPQ